MSTVLFIACIFLSLVNSSVDSSTALINCNSTLFGTMTDETFIDNINLFDEQNGIAHMSKKGIIINQTSMYANNITFYETEQNMGIELSIFIHCEQEVTNFICVADTYNFTEGAFKLLKRQPLIEKYDSTCVKDSSTIENSAVKDVVIITISSCLGSLLFVTVTITIIYKIFKKIRATTNSNNTKSLNDVEDDGIYRSEMHIYDEIVPVRRKFWRRQRKDKSVPPPLPPNHPKRLKFSNKMYEFHFPTGESSALNSTDAFDDTYEIPVTHL